MELYFSVAALLGGLLFAIANALGIRSRIAICLLFLPRVAVGQVESGQPAIEEGSAFYAVEEIGATVLQRGTVSSDPVFDQLFVAPNTDYRIWLLDPETFQVAEANVTSSSAGRVFEIPDFVFGEARAHDTDGDGLHDLGESIVGTSATNPDTDGDGLSDAAELREGLDPLDGLVARTGIIATVRTPGTALDVCALNGVAIVADGTEGISVFNVFNGMDPIAIAQVATAGKAESVNCSGDLVAVATRTLGLTVVDISDPPAARITRVVTLNSESRCVAVAGQVAFVGLDSGQVVTVDMLTGDLLGYTYLASASVSDLFLSGDHLFGLTAGTVHVLSVTGGRLRWLGSAPSPGRVNFQTRMRLSVGNGYAYPAHTQGYNTVDVAHPLQPFLVTHAPTPQIGWKQIVLNGSGLGVAAVSPNFFPDTTHNISLYDVSDPTNVNDVIVEFPTPGIAYAVSMYNGIAYVADGDRGLQVVNYLAYDGLGQPPTVSLTTNFTAGSAERGQVMRLTATVADDVQVRNVEFYLNKERLAIDGNFPFEHRFVLPAFAGRSDILVQARASDTGGNAAWSDEVILQLVDDATPPEVVAVDPIAGGVFPDVHTVLAYLSEPIDPGSLDEAAFRPLALG